MKKTPNIRVKRVYDSPANTDGARVLVDRLWPRGLKRADARLDDWLKEAAPTDSLRRWFGHDSARWDEFQRRYAEELDGKPDVWNSVLDRAETAPVTLLFASRDETHNNAVALKRYLERHSRRAKTNVRPRK